MEGRLETRSYEDKDGQKKYTTEVISEELILLDGRADGGGGGRAGAGEFGGDDPGGPDDFGGGGGGRPVSMPRSARSGIGPAKPLPEESFGGAIDEDVPF